MILNFVVLENLKKKKLLIQVPNICSIEEDDEEDYRLVTYKINEQLHRCVKVKETFEEITAKLFSC